MSFIPNVLKYEDDELTYSWIYRLAKANGIKSIYNFICFYINPDSFYTRKRYSQDNYDFFGYSEELCELINTTPIDLYYDTSIYHIFFPFMPINQQGRYINYMLRPNHYSKLTTSLNSLIKSIKICPKCMMEEINAKGYYYIHRAHQFPNVNVCYKHNCSLGIVDGKNPMEGIPNLIKLKRYNKDYEYAVFCKDFSNEHFDINIQVVKKAIFNKLHELGYTAKNYTKLLNNIQEEKFGELLSFDVNKFLKVKLISGQYIDVSSCMAILLYIFRTVGELKKYISDDTATDNMFIKLLEPDYEIKSNYHNDIVELQHKTCGTSFLISPKFFRDGWRCPCCQKLKDEEMFENLFYSVSNNNYELLTKFQGIDKKVKIRHKVCGNIYEIKARIFLYDNSRCICENRISIQEAESVINSYEGFKLIDFQSTNKPVTILHEGCGKTFKFDYRKFIKAPYCKVCKPRKRTIDSFRKEVYDLVGDEYSIISTELSINKKVEIRHNVCGIIQEYTPNDFIDGGRCKKCNHNITEKSFISIIKELSDDRYVLMKKETKNLYLVYDRKMGNTVKLTKAKILQELTRKTPSKILPLDNSCKSIDINRTYKDLIYKYIKEHYLSKDIIFLEDLKVEGVDYAILKNNINRLVSDGVIKSVALGMYIMIIILRMSNCYMRSIYVVMENILAIYMENHLCIRLV